VLVELVLVVVGILIALAVNSWIEDRKDARSERQYLERLLADFDLDLAVVREYRGFEEQRVRDGVLAYRGVKGLEDSQQERVAEALTRLISRRTLRLARATYSELLSTGNIGLIRNVALRDRIVRLYETNERWISVIDRNNLSFVDQMFAQSLLASGLVHPRTVNPMPQGQAGIEDFAGRLGVRPGPQDDLIWHLAPDDPQRKALLGRIWYRALASAQAVNQADEVLADLSEVRQAVVDELDRRWPG
jgi:hypothetical protein